MSLGLIKRKKKINFEIIILKNQSQVSIFFLLKAQYIYNLNKIQYRNL